MDPSSFRVYPSTGHTLKILEINRITNELKGGSDSKKRETRVDAERNRKEKPEIHWNGD
jgi:hypothetical protein